MGEGTFSYQLSFLREMLLHLHAFYTFQLSSDLQKILTKICILRSGKNKLDIFAWSFRYVWRMVNIFGPHTLLLKRDENPVEINLPTHFYKQPVFKQLAFGTNFLSNCQGWIVFNKQQYKIPDNSKMLSEWSAVFY